MFIVFKPSCVVFPRVWWSSPWPLECLKWVKLWQVPLQYQVKEHINSNASELIKAALAEAELWECIWFCSGSAVLYPKH
jgi:hypothetical protein